MNVLQLSPHLTKNNKICLLQLKNIGFYPLYSQDDFEKYKMHYKIVQGGSASFKLPFKCPVEI